MRASGLQRQGSVAGRGWLWAVVTVWWALRWLTCSALMRPLGIVSGADGGATTGAWSGALANPSTEISTATSVDIVWQAESHALWQPFVGAFLDVVVVACLAWLGRQPRARGPALVAIAVAGAARVFDAAHALALRAHFDAVSLWHLQPGQWRVGVESGAPVVLGAMAAVAWFSVRALRRAWHMAQRSTTVPSLAPGATHSHGASARGAWLLLVVVAFAAFGAWWSPLHARHGAVLPGLRLVAATATLLVGPPPGAPTMDAAAAARLVRAGLLPPHVALQATAPLWRPPGGTVHVGGVEARAEVGGRPEAIVLVLLESMNRAWTSLADADVGNGPRARLATPGLATLAALGTEVIGVHTAATPTHAALVAALCGVPPASWPIDANVSAALPLRDCLPRRLADLGYDAELIQGSKLGFTGLDAVAKAMGFAKARGSDDPLGPDAAPRSAWGWQDREVYGAALERVRAAHLASKPLFLVVATSDSHWPGFADPRCDVASEAVSAGTSGGDGSTADGSAGDEVRRMARALVCADAELGTFVRALGAIGDPGRRLLLVTADHAAPDTSAVRALLPAGGAGGAFAELPLIVVGPGMTPGTRLHAATSHFDLAPSILAWIGAPDRGGWLGRPIGQRSAGGDGQLQIGLSGRRAVGLRMGERRWQGAPGELQAACATGTVHPLAARAGLQPCDLTRWIDWIDGLWRDNRLAPAAENGTVVANGGGEMPLP